MLDVSEEAILCTGTRLEILWANQRARNLLGLSLPDNPETSLEEFISGDYKYDYWDRVYTLLDQIESNGDHPAIQLELLNSDPESDPIPVRVKLKRINIGHTWLVVHLIQRNLPKNGTSSIEFNRKLKLDLCSDELNDFPRILAHELHDPLRKIISFSERLDNSFREQLGKRGKQYLVCIGKAVRGFQNLVDALKDYSRIGTGSRKFPLTSLEKSAEEAISCFEKELARCQGTIEVRNLPEIEADPRLMHMLFKQIISNSLKFRHQSKAPRISIVGQSIASDYWKITFKDNGIGFKNDHARRIFAPCDRLHGNKDYEGTGMGLAISKKIVDLHHGHITCEGHPGKGATFNILLPKIHKPDRKEIKKKSEVRFS